MCLFLWGESICKRIGCPALTHFNAFILQTFVCESLFEAGLKRLDGCSCSPPPSPTPTRPLGLQLTQTIRSNFITTKFTCLVKQKGGQRPKGVETGQVPRPQATFKSFTQKERYFLYSYVDVLGRNGSGKPPALGGGGDDKAADLFPECSHGGQVLFTITIVDHFLSTLTSPRSCSKNPPSGEVGREQERHRPWSHGSTCE